MSPDDLTSCFAATRDHLRQVAYRMLGSIDQADDAVQQTWLRAERAQLDGVVNLPGWLTTVTARICLDALRRRRRLAERPLDADGISATGRGTPFAVPDEDAVMAESVGLALLVVLDRLSPAQRVAFVLHDLFAVPFDEIAPIVDRNVAATKKLASRARAQVRGAPAEQPPIRDEREHRAVVAAFLDAARGGDLDRLLVLLAPDVVRRADAMAAPPGVPLVVHGADTVARETTLLRDRAAVAALALVDGEPGIVVAPAGRLAAVLRITVAGGRITSYDVVAEPEALAAVDVRLVDPPA